MNNSLGKITGGVLLVAGTAAIWLWPQGEAPETEPDPVRPVRSAVVRGAQTMPDLKFSAVVRAGADRTLAFKHPGRIASIPVTKGQTVRRGDTLAWLMRDDFTNNLVEAEVALTRDRLTFERVKRAAERNAVSKEELSKAEAGLKRSEVRRAQAKLRLEESTLVAPFDGVVADVPGAELQMVSAADPVVVMLDLSTIKIDASVPESVVIRQRRLKCRGGECRVSVTFDSAQDRSYPVTFVEYKTMAEEDNQTFTATYRLPAPADLVLLPGMSATITVPGDSYAPVESSRAAFEVPESAVGVDADGTYFVWKLQPLAETPGVFTATKRRLDGCARVKGRGLVTGTGGVAPGERIATAGISVLSEGRSVSLLEDAAK